MAVKNRELVQSYILTTAKYDFSVQEKRILYRVIETLQHHLEGVTLQKGVALELSMFNDSKVRMPISHFLKGEDDQNYTRAIAALRSLRKKDVDIEYENGDLRIVGLIGEPLIERRLGYTEFSIHSEVCRALLDFVKGHRVYELKTAFEFESQFSMRFYELFSKQKNPIRYSIEDLKAMFGLSDKYKGRPADFIRFVIKVAKQELDEKSPYSFDYTPEKEGRKIAKILFKPLYLPDNEDKELKARQMKKRASVRWEISKQAIEALQYKFDFTDDEIKNNLSTLSKADKEMEDFVGFIGKKYGKSREMTLDNPKGWFINAVKKELNEV